MQQMTYKQIAFLYDFLKKLQHVKNYKNGTGSD